MGYQDGSLWLNTPFKPESVPEAFKTMLQALPMGGSLFERGVEGIVRWKLPLGWAYLPAILSALEAHGWSLVQSCGCGPREGSDPISIFLLHK
eukprot:TRINITY_DN28270_c0_g1_i1.p3 TRINITY_DN28270_c0_g1~~TRINITY_DN28270_c0_g1_i1.p3  ORF type:complete len:109 (+),score=15.17 TRINITY_DN28270_c0_g1_i1:49-327(+)